MSTIILELPGPPQGKARARVTKFGTYTPAKTRAYETALAWQAKVAMGGRALLRGPLKVTALAVFPIPPSWPKWKQAEARAGTRWPTGKPDWDNIAKVTDAFKGILWKDDASVVDGRIIKVYGDSPLLRFEVSEITPATEESDDRQTDSLRRGL